MRATARVGGILRHDAEPEGGGQRDAGGITPDITMNHNMTRYMQIMVVHGTLLGIAALPGCAELALDVPTEMAPDSPSPDGERPGYRVRGVAMGVIATANQPDVDITVAGRPALDGQPSQPIPLEQGETAIAVTVHHKPSGAEVSYEVVVERTRAVAQEA